MRIENHSLCDNTGARYETLPSPNAEPGLKPKFLLMHYTAGSSSQAAIAVLRNPRPDRPDLAVSAHLVIGRDGRITQLVPFDQIAYHAGDSYWENVRYLNQRAIGIELDNDGYLEFVDGCWRSASGTAYLPEQVLVKAHFKAEQELGWLKFPAVQLAAAFEAAQALVERYQLVDILGHDQVHREKPDPGPAFPMAEWRQQLFGRTEARCEVFQATRAVRLYLDEAGVVPVTPPRHLASPLPDGTRVKLLKKVKGADGSSWSLVNAKRTPAGQVNVTGWLPSAGLKANRVVGSAALYLDQGAVPKRETPLHPASPLAAGTRLRRLETKGGWTLVCTLEKLPRHGFVYGWVAEKDLQPAGA